MHAVYIKMTTYCIYFLFASAMFYCSSGPSKMQSELGAVHLRLSIFCVLLTHSESKQCHEDTEHTQLPILIKEKSVVGVK